MLEGVRIIEDDRLLDFFEDWSGVRSPGRAKRRRRQGHKQRIVVRGMPKRQVYSMDGGRTLVMHPAVAAALRAQTSAYPHAP